MTPVAATGLVGSKDRTAPSGSTAREDRGSKHGLTRIQLSRKRGWRMPPHTAKVDRTTPWGNFAGRGAADRTQAVAAFIHWIDTEATEAWKMAARKVLLGKNLACWCPLGEPCHADFLLGWINFDG